MRIVPRLCAPSRAQPALPALPALPARLARLARLAVLAMPLALLAAPLSAQKAEDVLPSTAAEVRESEEAARAGEDSGDAPAQDARPAPETRVKFAGGEGVSDELRRRAIADSLADHDAPRRLRAAIDDAAYALELLYHAEGFPFVKVTVSFRGGAPLPAPDAAPPEGVVLEDVVFVIAQGPRTVLASVTIEGNRAISDEELQELFRDPDRRLLGPRLGWYSADAIDDAISTIAAVYWTEGYLQAEVDEPVTLITEDGLRAHVTVTVHEGPPYRLRRAEFTGARIFPESELRSEVDDFLDRPYFPQVAFAARGRLLEFYGARGHAEATVDFEEVRDDATGDVGLLFRIEAGPRLSVAGIRIEGLERTETAFLLQRLAFHTGDTWSTAAQRRSYTALHRSGLFEGISIELQPGRGDAREVAVSVRERTAREVYIEPGFGSYEGPRATLGYRDRNVGGFGRILHAEGSVSALAQSALVGITDPWFGENLTADISVFANHREEPSFTTRNLGVAATLDLLLTSTWQTQFGYLYRHSAISDVDVVDAEVEDALENVDISSVSVSPIYDSRDDPFAPTEGMFWRTTLEYGGPLLGSELDFVRGGYTQSVFLPLTAADVLAASFRTGLIVPVGGTDVIPLQERYFNGGENTVRSFKEDELGPKDSDGNPIGGEAYSVFSVELRHALTERWGTAFFVDVGNVQEDAADYFRFSNRGAAVGAGLRYLLPIGPVRLDLGVNPDRDEDDDDTWVAHLSVGAPF
jgi:outer membrane protein insertion porin family